MPKVAIITGGASGMGLYVATELAQNKDEWSVHTIDLNAEQGEPAASSIGATFHQCNVTDYDALASVFKAVYQQHRRLDFVHANAGIVERASFAGASIESGEEPPPPPDMSVIEVNLEAVIKTTWLAMHYMKVTRKTLGNDSWEGNIVMTSSVAGIYAGYILQLYSAAKYGVVGLTRSLAPLAYRDHRIRVNCICPGLVMTGMTKGMQLPEQYITPRENIVGVVMMLIKGEDAADADGTLVKKGAMYGKAVEVSQSWFRWKEMPVPPEELRGLVEGQIRPAGLVVKES